MQPSATHTNERPGDVARALYPCTQCAHGNVADSEFCSSCGAPFRLMACPQCGEANRVTRASCRKCQGALANRSAPAESVRRAPARWTLTAAVLAAAAVVLATMAVLGFSVPEMLSYAHFPQTQKSRLAPAAEVPPEPAPAPVAQTEPAGACAPAIKALGLCQESGQRGK